MRIAYQTEAFPAGMITNGKGNLSVSWDELIWAAVTVGRPNRAHVLAHGDASFYELLFRLSMIRMTLEQTGQRAIRLQRTTAARTLDPSEKGAINYFLGLVVCKLFAAKCLNTPWLLHLDVFRPQLDVVLSGRSRPDLVGHEAKANRWHAFECKGRLSAPDGGAKRRAKAQAARLISVGGTPCTLHVGAITYFRQEVLHFYWRDPEPDKKREIQLGNPAEAWRHYYQPIAAGIAQGQKSSPPSGHRGRDDSGPSTVLADAQLSMHPAVWRYVEKSDWQGAHDVAQELSPQLMDTGYQADGIAVRAGATWSAKFKGNPQA